MDKINRKLQPHIEKIKASLVKTQGSMRGRRTQETSGKQKKLTKQSVGRYLTAQDLNVCYTELSKKRAAIHEKAGKYKAIEFLGIGVVSSLTMDLSTMIFEQIGAAKANNILKAAKKLDTAFVDFYNEFQKIDAYGQKKIIQGLETHCKNLESLARKEPQFIKELELAKRDLAALKQAHTNATALKKLMGSAPKEPLKHAMLPLEMKEWFRPLGYNTLNTLKNWRSDRAYQKDLKAYEQHVREVNSAYYTTIRSELKALQRLRDKKSAFHYSSRSLGDVKSLLGYSRLSNSGIERGLKTVGSLMNLTIVSDGVASAIPLLFPAISGATFAVQAGVDVAEAVNQRKAAKIAKSYVAKYANSHDGHLRKLGAIAEGVRRSQHYKETGGDALYYGARAALGGAAVVAGVVLLGVSAAGIATGYGVPIVLAGISLLTLAIMASYITYKVSKATKAQWQETQWDLLEAKMQAIVDNEKKLKVLKDETRALSPQDLESADGDLKAKSNLKEIADMGENAVRMQEQLDQHKGLYFPSRYRRLNKEYEAVRKLKEEYNTLHGNQMKAQEAGEVDIAQEEATKKLEILKKMERYEIGRYAIDKSQKADGTLDQIADLGNISGSKDALLLDIIKIHRIHKMGGVAMRELFRGLKEEGARHSWPIDITEEKTPYLAFLKANGIKDAVIEDLLKCEQENVGTELLKKYLMHSG